MAISILDHTGNVRFACASFETVRTYTDTKVSEANDLENMTDRERAKRGGYGSIALQVSDDIHAELARELLRELNPDAAELGAEARRTKMKATIQERGNGFPQVGDFVSGDDGELYLVVSIADRIFTGNATAGEPNYVYADIELADWDDVTDDNEPVCTAVISEDEDEDELERERWSDPTLMADDTPRGEWDI